MDNTNGDACGQMMLLLGEEEICKHSVQNKNTYHFMFSELKSIATHMQINFVPKLIMSNFEPGLLAVVGVEVSVLYFLRLHFQVFLQFVTATHSSFFFHFTQAIYRAIQRVGLPTNYNNDDDIKQYCRKLAALPLLPEAIIGRYV